MSPGDGCAGRGCRVCGSARLVPFSDAERCADCGFARRPGAAGPVDLARPIEAAGDPFAYAESLARATAPGGDVTIETADLGHWRAPHRLPPGTACGFTPFSLTLLLERAGLRVVSRRPSPLRPLIRVTVRRTM